MLRGRLRVVGRRRGAVALVVWTSAKDDLDDGDVLVETDDPDLRGVLERELAASEALVYVPRAGGPVGGPRPRMWEWVERVVSRSSRGPSGELVASAELLERPLEPERAPEPTEWPDELPDPDGPLY